MSATGRKLDKVWDYFNREVYKKGFRGKCKACDELLLGKKELLTKHLAQCSLVDIAARDWAKEELDESDATKKRKGPPPVEPGAPKLKQSAFTVKSMPVIDGKEQDNLDDQLMRFIASANLPFQVLPPF